ncbi:MAG: PAS domain S-box protein [Campylobacteraceae bacterium]|nr:PAS domain S-box protein [Campylobacteraceae bacterium]
MLASSLYQIIYESMQEGVYIFDDSGKVTQINPFALRVLGYEKDEVINKTGHDLFHAHAKNGKISLEECPIFIAFKKNVSFFGEEIFITKDGTYIDVEVSCTPLMNEKGKSKGYLVLFRNIGKRKKLEKMLKNR